MPPEDKNGINQPENDLNLVRGITAKDTLKLCNIGISSCRELAITEVEALRDKTGWTENKALNIVLHARAMADGKIYLKKPVELPDGVIYFYDIETYGNKTYLHGIIRIDDESREEKSFLARDPGDEGVAWRQFLEYLSRDDDAVIYSWTDFERRHVAALWESYGGDPNGWELLNKNLADQYALVKNHFALPTRSYSLKKVGPIFGFDWHTPDPSGQKAELWYGQWLETGDEDLLREIIVYNLDDVRAMEIIHQKLKAFNGGG